MKAARNMKYLCPMLEFLILVSAALALPPTIVLESPATIIYKEDSTVKLDCSATGDPKPTIEWYRNGAPLVIESGGRMTEEESALVISETYRTDEGYYMCKAKNKFGVAMSKTTRLWQAVLGPFDPTLKEVVYDVDEYKPLTVTCFTPKVAPNATYSWWIAESQVDDTPTKLILDKRIQMDDKGNLHFSHVIQADDSGENVYKCDVFNPFMDRQAGGSYSKIKVKPTGDESLQLLELLFSSKNHTVALENGIAKLRCFFSGYPDIAQISWKKLDGQTAMSRFKYSKDTYNSELIIEDVQMSDEGIYQCTGVLHGGGGLEGGMKTISIYLDIQAVPVFRSIDDRPHDVNVSNDDSVTINCRAHAEPKAQVVWFKNGIPIDGAKLPSNFKLNSDGDSLVIHNLCKDCTDGRAPTVIQCNASNVHGAILANGYINVLNRTLIVESPVDQTWSENEANFTFRCLVSSDSTTATRYTWFYNDHTQIRGDEEDVDIEDAGTLLVIYNTGLDSARRRHGRYQCNATNGYSYALSEVQFLVPLPPVPDIQPVAASSNYWLLLLIFLLIPLLIIIICCCQKCCRKGQYNVDKKERKQNLDPTKEIKGLGFQEYQRPPAKLETGSRPSLSKVGLDDSEPEFDADYDDLNAKMYEEDGSFRGEYGED